MVSIGSDEGAAVIVLTKAKASVGFHLANSGVGMSIRSASFIAIALAATVGHGIAEDDLASLATSDPNQFVSQLQTALNGAGIYDGLVNGLLDQRTISAINDACRTAGNLAQCQIGPLSQEGSQAVVSAIQSLNSEATAKASPAPAEEGASADVSNPEYAPESAKGGTGAATATQVEWQTVSSRNGIKITGAIVGEDFTASLEGAAVSDDYTNLDGSNLIEAGPDESWSFSVTVAADVASGASATARIRALGPNNKYLGEVGSGAPITGSAAHEYVVTGNTPEETVRVIPYIQIRYPAEAAVNDTIKISNATISAAN